MQEVSFAQLERMRASKAITQVRRQCGCGCVRNRAIGAGWTNLLTHIQQQHPNYDAIVRNKEQRSYFN